MEALAFNFDPADTSNMQAICDRYGDSKFPFIGENAVGETVIFEVYNDRIITTTLQHNGWNRTNSYHLDGTREETFEK